MATNDSAFLKNAQRPATTTTRKKTKKRSVSQRLALPFLRPSPSPSPSSSSSSSPLTEDLYTKRKRQRLARESAGGILALRPLPVASSSSSSSSSSSPLLQRSLQRSPPRPRATAGRGSSSSSSDLSLGLVPMAFQRRAVRAAQESKAKAARAEERNRRRREARARQRTAEQDAWYARYQASLQNPRLVALERRGAALAESVKRQERALRNAERLTAYAKAWAPQGAGLALQSGQLPFDSGTANEAEKAFLVATLASSFEMQFRASGLDARAVFDRRARLKGGLDADVRETLGELKEAAIAGTVAYIENKYDQWRTSGRF